MSTRLKAVGAVDIMVYRKLLCSRYNFRGDVFPEVVKYRLSEKTIDLLEVKIYALITILVIDICCDKEYSFLDCRTRHDHCSIR